jgi:hypothetical protein
MTGGSEDGTSMREVSWFATIIVVSAVGKGAHKEERTLSQKYPYVIIFSCALVRHFPPTVSHKNARSCSHG